MPSQRRRVARLPEHAPPDTGEENGATAESVALDGEDLVIRELRVHGAPAAAVRHRVEQGDDAERVVREMLDIGGAVLQHGAEASLAQTIVAEIRSDQTARLDLRQMEDRVSAKGLRYEEQVHLVLEAAFAGHGDIVEATGGTPGLDGVNKKGDFVATLNPESTGGRIRHVVIEAKDTPGQKLGGKAGALTYLTEAMDNRAAAAGILVCSGAVPALAGHRLRTYGGNRILVRYDKHDADPLALEVACQLARSLAAHARGDEDVGANAVVLSERIQRLREVIDQASEISSGAIQARRGIERVESAYSTMRTEALALIYELDDRLSE
jgi:hypothetical protein